jgi:hypothetical protein
MLYRFSSVFYRKTSTTSRTMYKGARFGWASLLRLLILSLQENIAYARINKIPRQPFVDIPLSAHEKRWVDGRVGQCPGPISIVLMGAGKNMAYSSVSPGQ